MYLYPAKKIAFLLILISTTFSLFAKEIPVVFIITKITNHVYIAHPGRVERINITSTIIVGATYLTVIESQTDVFMATALITEIRNKISKLPIKYLVFSHSHSDHISGAAAFLHENPSLIIIAQEKTAQHISLHASDEQKSWGETIGQKSIEEKQNDASSKSEEKKNYFLKAANELYAYYRDLASSVIVPPNLTFSDSLNLYDKDLQLQLKYLGAGHTPGDIVALILPDKVLVTGDLVHDYEPLFQDADPDSWLQVLEKIKQMDFDYFVGGHGDMHKGKNIIYLWQNYMKELKTKTIAAIKEGLTLEAFQNKLTIESFTSLQNGYGERIQQFRSSYMEYLTGPLLDAVKDEIAYMWKFYYAR
jgi:glyoxylase-like metal-dependent hydrolase (beta-lactamase superfamily II)